MSKIEIEIPDGKKAEWVNGVLTLVDEEPIEYKFKVGDKVEITIPNDPQYGEIVGLSEYAGEPLYTLKNGDANFSIYERYLELAPQSITERIETFVDAVEWCERNGFPYLVDTYNDVCDNMADYLEYMKCDLIAYLKLRIITAALNEGWEPTFEDGEQRWYICADEDDCGGPSICRSDGVITLTESSRLLFKSDVLAEYAYWHFLDIYRDYCGCKKGGEK